MPASPGTTTQRMWGAAGARADRRSSKRWQGCGLRYFMGLIHCLRSTARCMCAISAAARAGDSVTPYVGRPASSRPARRCQVWRCSSGAAYAQ